MLPVPKRTEDLTGRRFNRLVVLGYFGSRRYQEGSISIWLCRCDCGVEKTVTRPQLMNGQKSCGCASVEAKCKPKKHGMSKSPEYKIWIGMLMRCQNPKNTGYHLYGGKGIEVRYGSFDEFYADLGPRPSKHHSVDRIDGTKHYEAGNCRWALDDVQANNTSRNRRVDVGEDKLTVGELASSASNNLTYANVYSRLKLGWSVDDALSKEAKNPERIVEAFGQAKSVAAWARDVGISQFTIYRRLNAGWDVERALTQPVRK